MPENEPNIRDRAIAALQLAERLALHARGLPLVIGPGKPATAESAGLLHDLRRGASDLMTACTQIADELKAAEPPRPALKQSGSAGERARREILRRGGVAGDISARGFGL